MLLSSQMRNQPAGRCLTLDAVQLAVENRLDIISNDNEGNITEF